MKVLIVNQHISTALGGSEMQCDLIAKGLQKKGHEVIYAVPNAKMPASENLYPLYPVDLSSDSDFERLLLREQPDIIYWRYNKNFLLRSVATCKKLNIPFVFAVSHINDLKIFSFKHQWEKPFLKAFKSSVKQALRSARNYRAFRDVAGLTSLNGSYLKYSPVALKKKIWNAIDDEIEPFAWERDFCTWVANIKSAKRPEIFIEAARTLKKRHPNFDFLMIGKIQSPEYEQIIKQAAQQGDIVYLGQKSPQQVNGILKASKFLVHTCKPEGFGNNFIQAWLQGRPTITFEFDPDNLISDKGLGFVSGNLKRLVKDIETLMANQKLCNEIGSRARNFSEENFTTETLVKNLEIFLLETIKAFRFSKATYTKSNHTR